MFVDFEKRKNGDSHVKLVSSILEVGTRALRLRLKHRKIYRINSDSADNMKGAGLIHKGKKFLTHTTLEHKISAFKTFSPWQKYSLISVTISFIAGLLINPFITLSIALAILSGIYFIDVMFNLFLILKSLHFPPEIDISDAELKSIKDEDLPAYSILCPLYKEANVLPLFLESIKNLNYPKNKLDVQLLLEEDDVQTIDAVNKLDLPDYVRVNIVPDSLPKTKPKACNFGLSYAKGEYLVVYDAEDRPDRDQLKKSYLAFQKVKDDVVCLQAKLNYHNPHQNLLTRFFTAEYSLWFDVILPGLQTIETNIPLGGTSNHFRTKTLLYLKGWDPFNVTEDCDLGIRLFTTGARTAIINSTTLEEANSNFKNWLRQRSRWIKGYMQTFLVHTRNPVALFRKEGVHALIFQLTVGSKIAFLFINPILWLATIAYFAFYSIFGPTIETLYSPIVFYMAVFSAVFGNFLYLYYYMIGCAKRDQFTLIKFIFFIPVYWFMGSIAAFIALYQLIFKPHYWEKTNHGLNLSPAVEKAKSEIADAAIQLPSSFAGYGYILGLKNRISDLLKKRPEIFKEKVVMGGTLLIGANMFANVGNFIFNAFLGRELTLEQYGELSVFVSLLFLSSIPVNALGATVTQKVAYIYGKFSKGRARAYLQLISTRSLAVAIAISMIWVILIPFTKNFFNSENLIPFIIFTPVWFITILSSNFGGYLKGSLSFEKISFIVISESLVKLLLTYIFIRLGLAEIIYCVIPASIFVSLSLNIFFASKDKSEKIDPKEAVFNKTFFLSALLLGVTNIAFLGLDVILVKHYLSATETGIYGLLSLVGKMVFFFGSLVATFVLPVIAKEHGANQDTGKSFSRLFSLTVVLTSFASLFLIIFGPSLLPVFFGEKILSIVPYFGLYIVTIALFTIAQPVIFYFQAKENYYFVVISFFISLLQIILISLFHTDLSEVVSIMFLISLLNLSSIMTLFIIRKKLWIISGALKDFKDLIYSPLDNRRYRELKGTGKEHIRILIFNWRDIRHKWAGGAEKYIHEMAKMWVKEGHQVTIFCGNDGESVRHEFIEGVHIVRRGGFFMVYFWAVFYYLIRFRGLYDVIIDSENGIPFFTPLYSQKPKFLLIHHIHHEVFNRYLKFPFSHLAIFLETKLMPFIYRNEKIVTVSESSRGEIAKILGNTSKLVDVIYPGVDIKLFKKGVKTKTPTLLYLGRLKPYKNVEVLINSFKNISGKFPTAKLLIAGWGDFGYFETLKKLTLKLKLQKKIVFLGKVSEESKMKLLSSSWIFLQPSMVEGWGITVIEANASGTPVIASDVNGLRDSVLNGETGLLVSPDSKKAIEDAVILLLSDKKLREKLSIAAYEWAQNFTWDESNKKFLKLIEDENRVSKKIDLSFLQSKAVAGD